MTEEEIRPIAENYVEEYCHCSDGEYTDGNLVCAGIGTALIVSRQLEKRIEELDKENGKLEGKLTKAKEIINKFMSFQHIFYEYKDCDDLTKVLNKAEQFLKEESR